VWYQDDNDISYPLPSTQSMGNVSQELLGLMIMMKMITYVLTIGVWASYSERTEPSLPEKYFTAPQNYLSNMTKKQAVDERKLF